MIVSQIVAIAKNRVMGVNNTLPWHLPEDMKFFRDKTKGHIMIMGRKTFESLGKPLPHRLHIIITSNKSYTYNHPLVLVAANLEEALQMAKTHLAHWPEEVFIIGGSGVFKESFPYVHKIYLTMIDKDFQGDVLYPEFPVNQFKITDKQEVPGPLPFAFTTWERLLKIT